MSFLTTLQTIAGVPSVVITNSASGVTHSAALNESVASPNDVDLNQYFTATQISAVSGSSGLTRGVNDFSLHVCTEDSDVRARQRSAITSQLQTSPDDEAQSDNNDMARIMLESLPPQERAELLRKLLNETDELEQKIAELQLTLALHTLFPLLHIGCDCAQKLQDLQQQLLEAQNAERNVARMIPQIQEDGYLDSHSQAVAQEYVDSHPGTATAAQIQGALGGSSGDSAAGGDGSTAGSAGTSGSGTVDGGIPIAVNDGAGESGNGTPYVNIQTVGYVVEGDDGSVSVAGIQSAGTDGSGDVDGGIDPVGIGNSDNGGILLASYNVGSPFNPSDPWLTGADTVYSIGIDPVTQTAFLQGANGTRTVIPGDAASPLVHGGLQLVATDRGVVIDGHDHADDDSSVILAAFNPGGSVHHGTVGLPVVGTGSLYGDTDSAAGSGNGFSFAGFGRGRSTSGLGSFSGFFGSPSEFVAGNPLALVQFNPAFLGVAAGVAGAGQVVRMGDGQVVVVPHSGRASQSPHFIASASSRGDSGHGLTRDGGNGGGASGDDDDNDQPDDQPALFQFDDDSEDGAAVLA